MRRSEQSDLTIEQRLADLIKTSEQIPFRTESGKSKTIQRRLKELKTSAGELSIARETLADFAIWRGGVPHAYTNEGKLIPLCIRLQQELGIREQSPAIEYSPNDPFNFKDSLSLFTNATALRDYYLKNFSFLIPGQLIAERSNNQTLFGFWLIRAIVVDLGWAAGNRAELVAALETKERDNRRFPITVPYRITKSIFVPKAKEAKLKVDTNGETKLVTTLTELYLAGALENILPVSYNWIIRNAANCFDAVQSYDESVLTRMGGELETSGVVPSLVKGLKKIPVVGPIIKAISG
jgi:hypothetical protein